MLHPLHNVLVLPSGLVPASSRQLAEACSRLSDKNPNWKAQGLWLVIFSFRPRSKRKCYLSVPRQKLLSYQPCVQASLSQCMKTTVLTLLRTEIQAGLSTISGRALEAESRLGIQVLSLTDQLTLGKSQTFSTISTASCKVVVKITEESKTYSILQQKAQIIKKKNLLMQKRSCPVLCGRKMERLTCPRTNGFPYKEDLSSGTVEHICWKASCF